MMTHAIAPTRLLDLEAVIENGIRTFVEVGEALLEIRDGRLYRENHATFDDYCRERWGWQRAHAYRLMDGAKVAQLVSPTGDNPTTERQARELVPLLRQDEQQVVETWRELKDKYGDKITAHAVRDAVKHKVRRDTVQENRRLRAETAMIECEWPPGHELIPHEAWWKSAKEKIGERAAHLDKRRKRATSQGSLMKTVWGWNQWEELQHVSPEELEVPGFPEVISRLEEGVADLETKFRELLTDAMHDMERLHTEAPDRPLIPKHAKTEGQREKELAANSREKNQRGYCAFLGCWQPAASNGRCAQHPEGQEHAPARDTVPVVPVHGQGWGGWKCLEPLEVAAVAP